MESAQESYPFPDSPPPPYSPAEIAIDFNPYQNQSEYEAVHEEIPFPRPLASNPSYNVDGPRLHENDTAYTNNNQTHPVTNTQAPSTLNQQAIDSGSYDDEIPPAYTVATQPPLDQTNYNVQSMDYAQAAKYIQDSGCSYPCAHDSPSRSSAIPGIYSAPSGGMQPVMFVTRTVTPPPSAMSAYVLSCLVLWLCNIIFGCIAFWVAWSASSRASKGDYEVARKRIRISVTLSVIGMGVSFFLMIILAVALS